MIISSPLDAKRVTAEMAAIPEVKQKEDFAPSKLFEMDAFVKDKFIKISLTIGE
jgi:hypothetical protein